jgi:pyruvate/2-oxoglutarate dehydrogenase complex dihydrolipoamide acyltransferase (E2) component
MKRLVAVLLLVLPLGIIALGCEPPKKVAKSGGPNTPPPPPGSTPPPAPTPVTATPAPAPRPAVLPPETKVGVFAGGLDDLARGPAAEAAQRDVAQPDDPNLERLKAGKGVGQKGRSLDEYEGVYVTPAKTYFAAKERIVFDIQFPSQYQIYKAMSDDVPKDFDDLKAKVLDPYMIKLPELTPGAKYIWDAATEQLLVERPRLKAQ